jgi:hypothetical protein
MIFSNDFNLYLLTILTREAPGGLGRAYADYLS